MYFNIRGTNKNYKLAIKRSNEILYIISSRAVIHEVKFASSHFKIWHLHCIGQSYAK